MLKVESCVCGFRVYGAQWTPRIGENLQCAREPGNKVGPFAVAVKVVVVQLVMSTKGLMPLFALPTTRWVNILHS